MSFGSFCENSRRGPKSRDAYDFDNRFVDQADSRRRIFDGGMNGHGGCDGMNENSFQRRDRFREDSREFGGDHYQRGDDESDEEGEVKEAGATRDLREEIEAKRVRRQGSKLSIGSNRDREDSLSKRTLSSSGYEGGNMGSSRRDQGLDDPQERNGCIPSRRSESRRPGIEFRRNVAEGDVGAIRRRGPSPDNFRLRETVVGLRRVSPCRRASPGLRRSLGRSSSPLRRNSAVYQPEQRHGEGRFFVEGRGLSREPRDHDFREHQSPGRFGGVPGPGFLRDVPPLPVSRTSRIHVRNLPTGFSVDRLKADLFQDSIHFGRVLDVAIDFRGNERHAFVSFAEPSMAEDARRHMHRTAFHGSTLDVELEFTNSAPAAEANFRRKTEDREAGVLHMPPFQDEMDDPSSNCRVLVDDLDERLQDSEILNKFTQYGAMETFDVQRDRGKLSAVIRFRSLSSAVRARREMNGQPFGDRRCRVEYRFGDPTHELWVGGVHASVTEGDVNREFGRFGRVCQLQINRVNKCAFVLFERVEDAVQAAANMRGRVLGSASWKLKVDFADRSQGRSHSPGPGRPLGRFGKGGGNRSAEAAGPGQHGRLEASAEQDAPRPQQQHQPQQQQQQQQQPPHQQQHQQGGSIENHTPVSASHSGGSRQQSAGSESGAAAANPTGGGSAVGLKRGREGHAPTAEGHPEKKPLSIVIDSSTSADGPPFSKANGHNGLDCLTARPGAPGDSESAQLCETPHAHELPPSGSTEEPSVADPLERFPELWRGQAFVKGAAAGVVLRSVKCEDRLARDMLVGERVTMTQRMRLGEDQMKEFGLRLRSTGEASRGVLLAVPASAEDGPRLRQHFVTYLVERNAAGVARLDTGMLYLFPPGSELASEYQKSAAIDLSHHPDYLLVILLQDVL